MKNLYAVAVLAAAPPPDPSSGEATTRRESRPISSFTPLELMADEMIAWAVTEANSVANSRPFIGQSANRSFQDESSGEYYGKSHRHRVT